MTKEKALEAWKKMRSEIDSDNWLFVGTINPEMVDFAIEALSVAVSREDTVTLNSPISIQAEMVAVVRCKDCKFKRLYDESLYDEGDTKYYYCALEDRPNRNWSVDDTDYCAWGEEGEVEE